MMTKHIRWHKWTPEEVLEGIKERVRQKLSIRSSKVSQESRLLWHAAKRIFGNWTNACKASGIKIKTHHVKNTWPAGKVIAALRKASVTPDLYSKCGYLWSLALRFFPSRAFILEKFKIARHRYYHYWTRQIIIKCLKQRVRHKKSLNTMMLLAENRFLYRAARTHFGSYQKAVEAAGFDYNSIKFSRGTVPRRRTGRD